MKSTTMRPNPIITEQRGGSLKNVTHTVKMLNVLPRDPNRKFFMFLLNVFLNAVTSKLFLRIFELLLIIQ